MASIRRYAKGRWEVSIQLQGRQCRRMFSSREEGEAWMGETLRDLREVRNPGSMPRPLKEVADKYIAYKAAKGKRTVGHDQRILTKQLVPFFGATTPIADITAERIAQYELRRATEMQPTLKRPIMGSTINRHLSILRGLLRLAKKWGFLREVPHFEMGKEPPGRLRYLERDEALRLLEVCTRSKNPLLHAVVTVALGTGMRRGEILGFTWDRIDFARGMIRLDLTKNGQRREVPMNQPVYAVLSALPGPKVAGPVFASRTGTALKSVATGFEVALRRAGITDFHFHDLRHTFASWLVMDGATLQEVKELLGHRSLAMTLRYAHLAPGHLRKAVNRLDKMFETAAVGPPAVREVAETLAADPV